MKSHVFDRGLCIASYVTLVQTACHAVVLVGPHCFYNGTRVAPRGRPGHAHRAQSRDRRALLALSTHSITLVLRASTQINFILILTPITVFKFEHCFTIFTLFSFLFIYLFIYVLQYIIMFQIEFRIPNSSIYNDFISVKTQTIKNVSNIFESALQQHSP